MIIDIAKDFSTKPFGRDQSDGKFSGTRFRDEYLIKAFRETEGDISVILDGVSRGYGSSFLEESFAGLIRNGIPYDQVKARLKIVSEDSGYIKEIWEYIEEQKIRSEHDS